MRCNDTFWYKQSYPVPLGELVANFENVLIDTVVAIFNTNYDFFAIVADISSFYLHAYWKNSFFGVVYGIDQKIMHNLG